MIAYIDSGNGFKDYPFHVYDRYIHYYMPNGHYERVSGTTYGASCITNQCLNLNVSQLAQDFEWNMLAMEQQEYLETYKYI